MILDLLVRKNKITTKVYKSCTTLKVFHLFNLFNLLLTVKKIKVIFLLSNSVYTYICKKVT